MKVVFINPGLLGGSGLNVGLAYVISSVEKKHRVKLLDLSFRLKNYLQYIQREIEEYQPDIIAFSVASFTFQKSLEIGGFIKKLYPGISFIFGGVHPTLLPQETIQHPLVDAICIGEGEKSFLEYLNKLEAKQEPDVEGIWYKDRNGCLHKNRLRFFEENIDDLTFPNWDHWQIEKYLDTNLYYLPKALKHLASRGCPYDCSFCSNKAIKEAVPGRYYRARSAENIIEEIKLNASKYRAKGFKAIQFVDEIFGLDIEWLRKFCGLYKKEGLSGEFKWMCATRVDAVTKEWATLAAQAGCKMVMLGVESGDDHIRMQVYKKNFTRKDILDATFNLRKNGIAFCFYMMIGCPYDNQATIKASLDLVNQLDPLASYFSFYQPLPKTELLNEIKDTMWVHGKEFNGCCNIPKIRTLSLSAANLRNIMLVIRIKETIRFLGLGVKLKGLVFIKDVLGYLFSIKNWKKVLLMKFNVKSDLQQKTIFRYISESKK